MYILSGDVSYNGQIHVASCKVFNEISEIQVFLSEIECKWDRFSICPQVYEIADGRIVRLSDDFHSKFIYQYTYNSRNRTR